MTDITYKPSGIDWLGDIPSHWEVRRLKNICRFKYGNTLPDEFRQEGNIPVYGSNGVVGFHNVAITKAPCIIIGRKGSFGKLNFSNVPCFPIDTTYYIDETSTEQNIEWLFSALQILKLDSFSKDSAVPGLAREDAYEHYIPVPPLHEQVLIVSYLKEKTQLVDQFLAQKQRFIDLLREQKQAIINEAVTKGLYSQEKRDSLA